MSLACQKLLMILAAACALGPIAFAQHLEHSEWSILVFRSRICPPCDVLERETLGDPSVRRELGGARVSIIQVDEDSELSIRFLATATPRTIFLHRGSPEEFLTGSPPPARFLEEWRRISSGGMSTVSYWTRQLVQGKAECVVRGQLGIKQALLGDDLSARLQLNRMVVVTEEDKKARDDLQATIHNVRFVRARERVLLARSHGEVPGAFELRDFIREEGLIATTRFSALRMLIGVLEEQVSREADPARRDSVLGELARVKLAAWVEAARPLSDDDRRHAVEGVRGLLRHVAEPTDADRATAARIVEEFVSLRPDASDTRATAAVVLWLDGRRDEAVAQAKSISDSAARDELLAEFEMHSADRTSPR